MNNNLFECIECINCVHNFGQDWEHKNKNDILHNIRRDFEIIIQTAKTVMSMSDEADQRQTLANLLQNFDSSANDNDNKGQLHLLPAEDSNAYVMYNMLSYLTTDKTPNAAAQDILTTFERTISILTRIYKGRVPEKYIIGPYNYVDKRFQFSATILKNGSFIVAVPSIDVECPVSHRLIEKNGKYDGMVTLATVVNSEYDGNSVFQMFFSMASAIIECVNHVPDMYHDLVALYQDTCACESFDRDLCTEFLAAGLAYGAPYWDYMCGVGEIDDLDDDAVILWQMQIDKIMDDITRRQSHDE